MFCFLRDVCIGDVLFLRDDALEMCLLRYVSICAFFLFLGDVSIAGVLFLRDF